MLSIFVIISPTLIPALFAGVPSETCTTYTPLSKLMLESKYGIASLS